MSDEEQQEQSEDATPVVRQKQGFAFVDGDLVILKLLYDFRFLWREHISALVGRNPMSIHRRLSKLTAARYISVTRRPQQKHVYGLAKRSLPVLVEEGVASAESLDKRLRTGELTDLFFKHEMMLVGLHVMLSLASRRPESPLELEDWQEGRELWDSVSFIGRQGHATLPFRPDALFTVIDRRRAGLVANFFLEADRSSEVHPVFNNKTLAYWHYHDQRIHTSKFDIENFRVLTVTMTQARANNLCRMTADLPTSELPERARKLFLYTSLQALGDGTHIFDAIYHSAQAPTTARQLIPPPQQT